MEGQQHQIFRSFKLLRECANHGRIFKIAALRGDVELALRLNTEAGKYLQRSDYLDLRGDVLLDRAEVLRLAGRVEEAQTSATEALQLYEQKGNLVSAERAQAMLDHLDENFRGVRA